MDTPSFGVIPAKPKRAPNDFMNINTARAWIEKKQEKLDGIRKGYQL